MSRDRDQVDPDEIPILEDSFKDIELIVKTAVAVLLMSFESQDCRQEDLLKLVEKLHPNIRVEHHRLQTLLQLLTGVPKNPIACKVQC